uniref:ARAD1C35618p n=1 Tax=Blastobotrys adeninivorans TaxID=409370 RepID=A0A060T966_BLAAD
MVLPILIGIAICVAVEEYKKRKRAKAQRRHQEIVDAYENGIVDTPDNPDTPPPPYSKNGPTTLPKPLKPQQSTNSSKNKLSKLHMFSRKRRRESVHASGTVVDPVNSADYPPAYTY